MSSGKIFKIHIGPPASGKTHVVLERLQRALKTADWGVRLLVPSATMAEHLRNRLAREGLLLRKTSVTTLSRFVEELGLETAAPDEATLGRSIANSLAKNCPLEYSAVASMLGFVRHVAKTLDALSLAGVSPEGLDSGLSAIYASVTKDLRERGLALRGERLVEASRRVNEVTASCLLLDGFFSFAATEIELLQALATQCDLEITLPLTKESERAAAAFAFTGAVVERLSEVRRRPRIEVLRLANREQELLRIAERILRLVADGVELRGIGVILRNPARYAGLVESTFAGLGIPSRSYLGEPLAKQQLTLFFRDFVKAVEARWDYVAVLRALRWRLTGLGGGEPGDRLEIAVCEALPGQGLEPFVRMLPELAAFEGWPQQRYSPAEAALQLMKLRVLVAPPAKVEPTLEEAFRWNQISAALRQIEEVLRTTVESFDAGVAVSIVEFWRAAEAIIAEITLHERDTRRNVVHVMDVFESRQWELDYVFAPGMVEGEFPSHASPDPLITEAMRRAFGMKTMEDRQEEERFLFEVLRTRATVRVELSYPESNEKGDPVAPSLFLETTGVEGGRFEVETVAPPLVEEAGQLSRGYRRPVPWSATEFEVYLDCPWKHFAAKGLKLRGRPEAPGERLNALAMGKVVHRAIAGWTEEPSRSIEWIGEQELEQACRELRIPDGYRLERQRINLLRNLRLYARNAPMPPAGWQSHLEEEFELLLEPKIEVRGRIDRYDVGPDGEVRAYDYKYSKTKDFGEVYPVQGALYSLALAAKGRVSSFGFIALRDESKVTPIEGPALANLIALARQQVEKVVERVREGAIPVEPADRRNCQYCDYLDACRVRARPVEIEVAEEAGE